MNKTFLHILLLFCSCAVFAQVNLVPNGSFEDFVSCPTGAANFQAVAEWYNPTLASPDYYNSCDTSNGSGVPSNDLGFQYAQHGNAYVGLVMYAVNNETSDYREYIQVKLSQPLLKDSLYCWSLYVSLLDKVDYASDNFGIAITNNAVLASHNSVLFASPFYECDEIILDSVNWVHLEGVYQAFGGEEYLTIGNFKDNNATNVIQINTNSNGGKASCYYVDNIWLGRCTTSVLFPNIFTPNNDGVNDIYTPKIQGVMNYRLGVLNRWGTEVFSTTSTSQSWDGTYKGKECSEGIYYYICSYTDGQNEQKTKTGFIHLIR